MKDRKPPRRSGSDRQRASGDRPRPPGGDRPWGKGGRKDGARDGAGDRGRPPRKDGEPGRRFKNGGDEQRGDQRGPRKRFDRKGGPGGSAPYQRRDDGRGFGSGAREDGDGGDARRSFRRDDRRPPRGGAHDDGDRRPRRPFAGRSFERRSPQGQRDGAGEDQGQRFERRERRPPAADGDGPPRHARFEGRPPRTDDRDDRGDRRPPRGAFRRDRNEGGDDHRERSDTRGDAFGRGDKRRAPFKHDDHRRGPKPGAERRILGREKARRAQSVGEDGALWIYGKHAVAAAAANPARTLKRILVAETAVDVVAGLGLPAERRAIVEEATAEDIETLLHPGASHQNIAALVEDLPRARLRETCEPADPRRPVVILDQITDPQNIGAILRSAAAFGARAVVVQDRRTPPLAGALAKAAAGAVELTPCVKVVNIARAVEALKEIGYFCAGLEGAESATIDAVPADRPIAIVLGSEGEGLRRLVADTCDGLFRIPIDGAVESLNVSTAAAVALFATTRARGPKDAD